MRLSIELAEMYVTVLSKWASVSRTLRTAESCCGDIGNPIEERALEKYRWCRKELETLIPALNHLHQVVRSAIWLKQQKHKRHRLRIMDIHIDQKRILRNWSDIEVEGMMENITEFGQEVPILVVPREDGTFTMIDGLLRFKAMKLLGWTEIDAIEPTS